MVLMVIAFMIIIIIPMIIIIVLMILIIVVAHHAVHGKRRTECPCRHPSRRGLLPEGQRRLQPEDGGGDDVDDGDGDEDVDDKSYKVQRHEDEDGDDGDNGRSCAKEISKVAKCSSVKMKISKNVKMKKPKLMQMYPQEYHLEKRRIHQLHDECPRVLTRV